MFYTVANPSWERGSSLPPAMVRVGLSRSRPLANQRTVGGAILAVSIRYDRTRGVVVAEGTHSRGQFGPWSSPAIVDMEGRVMVLACIPAALVREVESPEIRLHAASSMPGPRLLGSQPPPCAKQRTQIHLKLRPDQGHHQARVKCSDSLPRALTRVANAWRNQSRRLRKRLVRAIAARVRDSVAFHAKFWHETCEARGSDGLGRTPRPPPSIERGLVGPNDACPNHSKERGFPNDSQSKVAPSHLAHLPPFNDLRGLEFWTAAWPRAGSRQKGGGGAGHNRQGDPPWTSRGR